jgi:hypothetical protein
MEYLTVALVRETFGDRVSEMTDVAILRSIDRLSGVLEDQLGHTFGRAAVVTSTDAADTVEVTATGLTIGGTTYLFADYPTLADLETAVNAAAHTYSMTIFPRIAPATPSTLLKPLTAIACGPDYLARKILDITAFYYQTVGGTSHIFLPLPIAASLTITENGVLLASTAYSTMYNTTWVIRKLCACTSTFCSHQRGKWSCYGNIVVTYLPRWWRIVPAAVQAALLAAFASMNAVGHMASESFGGAYSYSRNQVAAVPWIENLRDSSLRPYIVRGTILL